MTTLGRGPLILMGKKVMGNLYPAPPTLEKLMSPGPCPVLLTLSRSYSTVTGHQRFASGDFILLNTMQTVI
jgi:hypothetical protein